MITSIIDFIAPRLCAGCDKKINKEDNLLCSFCREKLYSKKVNMYFRLKGGINGTALWEYQDLIKKLITNYKFKQKPHIANLFNEIFLEEIQKNKKNYNAIVVIPSTLKSMQSKGYSHMHLIARKISKHSNIPFLHNALRCSDKLNSQKKLSLKERKENREHAYTFNNEILDKNIILLDDVVTSGHTLNSAIQSMLDAGAKKIDAYVLARTAKNQFLKK